MAEPIPPAPDLSAKEQFVYDWLNRAAEKGQVCPTNIDIEVELGLDSCSMGSWIFQRLELKGLIVVQRGQRSREVQIVKTGKWTAPSRPTQPTRPHVQRGSSEQQERFVAELLKLAPHAAKAAGYSDGTDPRKILKYRNVLEMLSQKLGVADVPRGIRSKGAPPTDRKPSKARNPL